MQGTFDDLSEHEKTRALLQFLQYHQQLERTNDTKQFREMIGHSHEEVATPGTPPVSDHVQPDLDEKAIEEGLKVWYGLNKGSNSGSILQLSLGVVLATIVLAVT